MCQQVGGSSFSLLPLFFSSDVLGETIGRVHVGVQDFAKLHTPHFHGSRSHNNAGTRGRSNDVAGAETDVVMEEDDQAGTS